MIKSKTCSKCNLDLLISNFHKRKGSTDGYRGVCKECRSTGDGNDIVENLEGEIWKPAHSLEDKYLVSNMGRIKSVNRKVEHKNGVITTKYEKLLKTATDTYGYNFLNINEEGRSIMSVHRLIALSFIENPHNLPEVNHKNLIKSDNRVENLEWISLADNQRHRRLSESTESNLLGVHRRGKIWYAVLRIENIQYLLAKGSDKEYLHDVYIQAVNNYNNYGKLPETYLKKNDKSRQ